MVVTAYGTFRRVDSHIFRTAAMLKWGASEKNLGILIMLNPGSCKLNDDLIWEKLSNGFIDVAEGSVALDETMKAVVSILTRSHPNLEGILHVHNLFNLRNATYDDALEIYKKICKDKNYQDALHTNFTQVFKTVFPWAWLAWSVADNKEINKRKRDVYEAIPQKVHKFLLNSEQLKYQKSRIHIYHPLPRKLENRLKYEEMMVYQMKKFWASKALHEKTEE